MVDDSALRARLTTAAESGEILRTIYHGGSQPGSARDMCPIEISGALLRARDVAAGADKQFPSLEARDCRRADDRADVRSAFRVNARRG